MSDPSAGAAFRRLAESALEVPGPETERIGRAAAKARAHLCVGVNERTPTGTLHCTLLLFGPTGELRQARRKLVPTHDERMVWGPGDAVAPRAVPTEHGPVGQLTCWENYMPLARYALWSRRGRSGRGDPGPTAPRRGRSLRPSGRLPAGDAPPAVLTARPYSAATSSLRPRRATA